jgi:PKD repeat protein
LESASPVELGTAMQFSATVSGDGPISYTWDFGGAGTQGGTDANPTFLYDEVGTYTVTLEVANSCPSTYTAQIGVVVEPPPCEDVSIEALESDSPVELGVVMQFSATVSGDGPISYTWDFGGAGTQGGTDVNPTFLYDEAGTYTVTLEVANNCPSSDTLALGVEIVWTPACTPVVGVDLSLLSSGTLYLGEEARFGADLSPDDASKPYTYTVDYGDGSALVPAIAGDDPLVFSHTYAATGTYVVEFAVWNCDMTLPVTDSVQVLISMEKVGYTVYLPIVIRND